MIGKVKYIGKSFGVDGLTNGKVYDCVSIELPFIRVIDDSGEDYLYSIKKPCSLELETASGKWIIVEDKQHILEKYI